jgi:hypothetical protein
MSTMDNDGTVLDDDDPNGGDWQQLSNIVYHTHSFADPQYQQRVWITGTGPEVNSYSESRCGHPEGG